MSNPPSNDRARQLLAEAGQLLYGDEWKGNISRRLKVRRETPARWMSGRDRFDMGNWAWPQIEALLRDAGTPATIRLAETIKAEAVPTPLQKTDTPSAAKDR